MFLQRRKKVYTLASTSLANGLLRRPLISSANTSPTLRIYDRSLVFSVPSQMQVYARCLQPHTIADYLFLHTYIRSRVCSSLLPILLLRSRCTLLVFNTLFDLFCTPEGIVVEDFLATPLRIPCISCFYLASDSFVSRRRPFHSFLHDLKDQP